jgi:hypothetical protein
LKSKTMTAGIRDVSLLVVGSAAGTAALADGA